MLRTREEELGRLRGEYQQLKEAMERRQREEDESAQQLRSKDQEILQLKVKIHRHVELLHGAYYDCSIGHAKAFGTAQLGMLSCSTENVEPLNWHVKLLRWTC